MHLVEALSKYFKIICFSKKRPHFSYIFSRLDLKLVERIILALPQAFMNAQTQELKLKEILNGILTDIDQHCNLADMENFYATQTQAAVDFENENGHLMSEYDQLNYLPAINGEELRTAILRYWGNDAGTFKV